MHFGCVLAAATESSTTNDLSRRVTVSLAASCIRVISTPPLRSQGNPPPGRTPSFRSPRPSHDALTSCASDHFQPRQHRLKDRLSACFQAPILLNAVDRQAFSLRSLASSLCLLHQYLRATMTSYPNGASEKAQYFPRELLTPTSELGMI